MPTVYGGFQLGLLPERKVNKRAMMTGYALVALLLLIAFNIGLILPEQMQVAQYHMIELIPMPSLRPEPPPVQPKPELKAKLLPPVKLPILDQPKLVLPPAIHHEAPQPVEAPKVVVNQFAAPQIKMAVSAARPQLVHTGDFGGSSQKPTVNAAVEKVQTGGFGDPNGLPGTGKQGAKLYAASTGSFDMPAGPGQGNGSGGAKGIKGTVASADFGAAVASSGSGNGRGKAIATGGFATEQVAQSTGPKIVQPTAAAATPVEITFKPNPAYTDEARSMKLEGEVLLEVSFSASGTLHVNRVVRGLGHGLDEAAVAAANKIRFKPALQGGQPVDSTAIVHVTFQLAY
ncbi:MAG TPA: energy transducer TonB [Candidatus Sulfotelmatobacter sp.]|nr:energy transducer TonB [Candidatus Sulfotelmatobacter sp.]